MREEIDGRRTALEDVLEADVMAIISPIVPGLEVQVRDALLELEPKRSRVAVVLQTHGGVISVVERMVGVLRASYGEIVFVVPDQAMSAGTVFASLIVLMALGCAAEPVCESGNYFAQVEESLATCAVNHQLPAFDFDQSTETVAAAHNPVCPIIFEPLGMCRVRFTRLCDPAPLNPEPNATLSQSGILDFSGAPSQMQWVRAGGAGVPCQGSAELVLGLSTTQP